MAKPRRRQKLSEGMWRVWTLCLHLFVFLDNGFIKFVVFVFLIHLPVCVRIIKDSVEL
jgi:hypothetical protein